jgi:ABC-type phosphate transport system substrate-binding protein
MPWNRLAGVLALFLAGPAGAADAYKVVVFPGNPSAGVTRAELSDIFLGHATEWPDGTRIVPVDQVETAPVRQAFSLQVHRRRAAAIRSHWLQVMYSGRGVPPVEKASDASVIAYVRTHAGAIGYVAGSTPTDGVKVLKVAP